jgi:hypothetical protein
VYLPPVPSPDTPALNRRYRIGNLGSRWVIWDGQGFRLGKRVSCRAGKNEGVIARDTHTDRASGWEAGREGVRNTSQIMCVHTLVSYARVRTCMMTHTRICVHACMHMHAYTCMRTQCQWQLRGSDSVRLLVTWADRLDQRKLVVVSSSKAARSMRLSCMMIALPPPRSRPFLFWSGVQTTCVYGCIKRRGRFPRIPGYLGIEALAAAVFRAQQRRHDSRVSASCTGGHAD